MNQYNVATIYQKIRKRVSTMLQQITKNEKTIKYNIAKFTIYLRQENELVQCGNNYQK